MILVMVPRDFLLVEVSFNGNWLLWVMNFSPFLPIMLLPLKSVYTGYIISTCSVAGLPPVGQEFGLLPTDCVAV